jgi:hypothetical protein
VRDRVPTLSDVQELIDGRLSVEAQARELFDGWFDSRLKEFDARVKKLEARQTFWGICTIVGALVGGMLAKVL